MFNRKLTAWMQANSFFLLSLLPLMSHASFIEATLGTAVVKDATASFYNPAALTILKNPQIITLGSSAVLHTHFTGQSTQIATGFTQSGRANSDTHYQVPSLFLGLPTQGRITLGLTILGNSFNREGVENSILRYDEADNDTKSIDFAPAIGFKLNECFAVGAAINFSRARFLSRPRLGFPSLNIPDSESHNECSGNGVGGDVGLFYQASKSTTLGFNYRSLVKYELSGTSTFKGLITVVSHHYGYQFWTPARSVFSINQFFTPTFGMIGTIERIQWSVIKNIKIHGIATAVASRSAIVNAKVPHRLRDAWLLTLGTHYRATPKWIIRLAATYNQSPGNSNYQITFGDSLVVGGSMGYDINKHITIDGSYAHGFIQKRNIHINRGRNSVQGVNRASRDGVSLKLTLNV